VRRNEYDEGEREKEKGKKEVKGGRERVWRDRIVRDWDWDC
jgi:hypothetical protein